MKKIIMITICLIMAVMFAACTGNGTQTKEDQTDSQQQDNRWDKEEEQQETPVPTQQILQENDIIGLWQVTNYKGEDNTNNCEFIEFTQDKAMLYKMGEYIKQDNESFSLDDGRMTLFLYEYKAAMDGDEMLLAPIDPQDPLMLLKKSSEQEMAALIEQERIVDIKELVENKWEAIGYQTAPGASADKIPLIQSNLLFFNEDGTFKDGKFEGTYELEEDKLAMKYRLIGNCYTFTITIKENTEKDWYDMSLLTEDQKVVFNFRAFEKR